jgi:hypothetical protein
MIMNKKMLIKMMMNSGSEISYSHGLKMFEALFVASCHARKNFYTQTPLHTEPFKQRRLYTQTLWHIAAFTQRSLYTKTPLHRAAFTHRSFYTERPLHKAGFTHMHFLHTAAFTHGSFYTEKPLHRAAFAHPQKLNTQTPLPTEAFTHGRSLYTACAQRSLCTGQLLHTNGFTNRSLYIERVLRVNAF